MGLIGPPLFAAHVSRRDHANPVSTNGKDRKQQPSIIRPAQDIIPTLSLGVFDVVRNNQGTVEKDLLAFKWRNPVLFPYLLSVGLVPFKANTLG